MTNFEVFTLILSILALVIAIVSPFISYYLLDPQLQAFRNRARLKIDSDYSLNTKFIPASSANELPRTVTIKTWILNIKNVGALPARDIQIVLSYEPVEDGEALEPKLEFDPPILNEQATKSNEQTVTLKRPIAPNDQIMVSILKEPNEVWVYTEFGEASNIKTAVGRENMMRRFRKENPGLILTK